MMEDFIERHSQDITVDGRHSVRTPVLCVLGDGAVEGLNFAHGSFKQAARKGVDVGGKLAPVHECLQDVSRRVLAHLPLEKHLERQLTSFGSRTH